MKRYLHILIFPFIALCFTSCKETVKSENLIAINESPFEQQPELSLKDINLKKVVKTDTEWKKILTDDQYTVLRQKGTERPYDNKFDDNKRKGNYFCAACKLPLFSSETKFDSGTGWPSFYDVIDENRVKEVVDKSQGMVRGEIICARCDGHLGHLFDDGPNPTGLRYCMNSAAMLFQESK